MPRFLNIALAASGAGNVIGGLYIMATPSSITNATDFPAVRLTAQGQGFLLTMVGAMELAVSWFSRHAKRVEDPLRSLTRTIAGVIAASDLWVLRSEWAWHYGGDKQAHPYGDAVPPMYGSMSVITNIMCVLELLTLIAGIAVDLLLEPAGTHTSSTVVSSTVTAARDVKKTA